jgi:nucleotide-binding universal stress UspA family protein
MALKIQRILAPTDYSECARAALDYAAFLALHFGATVRLLHVWELPVMFGGVEAFVVSMPATGAQPLADAMRKRAEAEMEAVVTKYAREGTVRFEGEVVMGTPANAIVDASVNYDLVVMGTHGRGAVSHALLGSVAERVVRRAKCAVLTIRHP